MGWDPGAKTLGLVSLSPRGCSKTWYLWWVWVGRWGLWLWRERKRGQGEEVVFPSEPPWACPALLATFRSCPGSSESHCPLVYPGLRLQLQDPRIPSPLAHPPSCPPLPPRPEHPSCFLNFHLHIKAHLKCLLAWGTCFDYTPQRGSWTLPLGADTALAQLACVPDCGPSRVGLVPSPWGLAWGQVNEPFSK